MQIKQKTYTKKIIIITLTLSIFFVLGASTSFAVITAPTELKTPATLFEFPRKADGLPADKQTKEIDVFSTPSPTLEVIENENWSFPIATFVKVKEITGCVLNNLYFDVTNLFKKTGLMFSNTYNFLASALMNLRISFSEQINKINGSAFTNSLEQIKKINGNIFSSSFEQINKINGNAFITSISNLKNLFNQTTQMIKNVYNSLSSYLINLRN